VAVVVVVVGCGGGGTSSSSSTISLYIYLKTISFIIRELARIQRFYIYRVILNYIC
jgi:cytidylate kinase